MDLTLPTRLPSLVEWHLLQSSDFRPSKKKRVKYICDVYGFHIDILEMLYVRKCQSYNIFTNYIISDLFVATYQSMYVKIEGD